MATQLAARIGLSSADAPRRREVMLWLLAGLLAHQLLATWLFAPRSQPQSVFGVIAVTSVFYWLAWFAAFRLVLDSGRAEAAGPGDIAVTGILMAANFLSRPSIAWTATTIAGLYLLARHQRQPMLVASGSVLLALALNGFWGPHIFDVFAYQVARLDAALVGAALAATRSGITWSQTIVGAEGGHSIIVYGPCSSFHNVSLGLLCWIALARLARPRWALSDMGVGLLVCAAVITLNSARLYLMALSAENFTYWHEGTGQHLFASATTLCVLLISAWGAVRIARTA